jgi:hypothetical protein
MDRVQVEILGLATQQASNQAYTLILKEASGPRRLPIIIGGWEAQSIALEMEGIKPPRPLTHDLLKNIVDALGSTITEVTISDLRDGTFYAKLHVDGTDEEIDSRPSDAIALAVRFSVPMYVSESVMSEASFVQEGDESAADDADEDGDAPFRETPATPAEPEQRPATTTRSDMLRQQLQDAISREEYELAAQLRDELQKARKKE